MVAFFKRIYKGNIIYAIALILLGIIFAVWPASSRVVLVRALGIALLLCGAIMAIGFFTKRLASNFPGILIGGIILAIVGILIVVKPEQFVSFVIIVAGAFMMLSGVMNFCQTLSLATLRFPYWWVGMILSILTIICSVLVLARPTWIADAIFMATGIFMVYDGLSNLFLAYKLRQLSRRIREDIIPQQ